MLSTGQPEEMSYVNYSMGTTYESLLAKNTETQVVDPENKIFDSLVGVFHLPYGSIRIGNYLAEGAFGEVFRGTWGDRPVAIKKIDFGNAAKKLGLKIWQVSDSLGWEISRLSTVHHPNLVQFYGIYQQESQGHTYLIMEFCEGGTLQGTLKKGILPPSTLWQWSLEITEGLSYLHNQGILHRDLKSENILLDSNHRAKLADLGVAQVDSLLEKDESHVVAYGMQDKRFIAPENIGNEQFSSKVTDIYALGLVFWEMVSRTTPRNLFEMDTNEFNEWKTGSIDREPIPVDCPVGFRELILSCWKHDPTLRPTADELVVRLKELGPEFHKYHTLVQTCEKLELLIHPKRKNVLSYVEPFITKHVVEESMEEYWGKWENKQDGPNPPMILHDVFWKFINSQGPGTLLLLGEAGLGKTLTTYIWADWLIKQWWVYLKDQNGNSSSNRPAYLPIFIRPLVKNWSHKELKGVFLKAIKEYGLEDNIPVLLFVDGYDELQIDNDDNQDNLAEHMGLKECLDVKLVVTCRPIMETSDINIRFNFRSKLKVRYFLPFSIDQLLGYLKDQLSWSDETKQKYKETLETAPSVRTVLRNPFVLYLLRQSWKTIVSQKSLNQLTRWQIYEGFVEHAITTQKMLISESVQDILTGSYPSLLDSFDMFASGVAFTACRNKSITLIHDAAAKQQLVSSWVNLKNLVENDTRKQFKERQTKINEMTEENQAKHKRRALLTEQDFVQMMQTRLEQFEVELPIKHYNHVYEFIHKSLFEFFTAKYLIKLRDQEVELITTEDFKSIINRLVNVEHEVLLFLHEGWEETKVKELTGTSVPDAQGDRPFIKLTPVVQGLGADRVQTQSVFEENEECSTSGLITQLSTVELQIGSIQQTNLALLLNAIGKVLIINKAKHTEAMEYFLKSLSIFEKVYGKEHPMVTVCYNKIGGVLEDQGKHKEAMEYFLKSLAIYEKVYGKDHPKVAVSFCNIGRILKYQGEHKEAMEYFLKSLAISEKVYGKDHSKVAISFRNIGQILKDQGEYKEAMEYFLKSLAIYEKVYGKEHPRVAMCYNDIGQILKDQGEHKEAMEYYLKSLVIFEKVYGKEHPSVAVSYSNIGQILKDQGEHKQAMEYFLKSLAISEKVYGKGHPNVAVSYSNIGQILKDQGEPKEAMEYFLKSLAISEKVYGKDHPEVAVSYSNIGQLLLDQGEHKEAMEYFLKQLAIFEKVYGKEHPHVAVSYSNIGKLHKDQGEHKEAMEYFLKSLAIFEKVYGKEHPCVAVCYKNIGEVFNSKSEHKEAMEYFLKSLAISEKVYGKDHPKVALCYNNIGEVFKAKGENKEAMEYFLKHFAIYDKVYGKGHPEVAVSYNNIGEISKAKGEHKEAMEYFLKSLAIYEKVYNKEHPKVALCYNNIGEVLKDKGEHKEAMEYFHKSLAIYERVYGKEHPKVAVCYVNIGEVLKDQGEHK